MPIVSRTAPHGIIAAVDTNVLLDVVSVHDVMRIYDRLRPELFDAAPEVAYRRARARESTILALHLSNQGATTYSLYHEATALVTRNVEPKQTNTFETHFTAFFAHFLFDRFFSGWKILMDETDPPLRGNEADNALLNYAERYGVPIISNEGYTAAGLAVENMRKQGAQRGVLVLTPGEYYASRLDEHSVVHAFLAAFRESAPSYIEPHPNREIADESLKQIYWVYEDLLIGTRDRRDDPVRGSLVYGR